jgi:hypothetical protein
LKTFSSAASIVYNSASADNEQIMSHPNEDELFKLVFRGDILPGNDPSDVKRNLAALFKVDLNRIEKLFQSEKPVVIKNNLKRELAEKYKLSINKAGAECSIVAVKLSQPTVQTTGQTGDKPPVTSITPPNEEEKKEPKAAKGDHDFSKMKEQESSETNGKKADVAKLINTLKSASKNLITCKDCGSEISSSAVACPQCGATSSGSLLRYILPLRGWLLAGIFILSIVSFFSTNFSVTIPILGTMRFSMYDLAKLGVQVIKNAPEKTEPEKNKPDLGNIVRDFKHSEDKEKGFGNIALLLLWISVLGLALHYLLTVIVAFFAFRKVFSFLIIIWLLFALQFPLFFSLGEKILLSEMKSEMTTQAKDNPFATLGTTMINSFSLDPGAMLWILMIASTAGLVLEFLQRKTQAGTAVSQAENVKTDTEGRNINWRKWGIICGSLGLVLLLLIMVPLFNEEGEKSAKSLSVTPINPPRSPAPPVQNVAQDIPKPALQNISLRSEYVCANGNSFQVEFTEGKKAIVKLMDGRTIELERSDEAVSGFAYRNKDVLFRGVLNEGNVEIDNTSVYGDCKEKR